MSTGPRMIVINEKALDLQPLNNNGVFYMSAKFSCGQRLSNNKKRFDYTDCVMFEAKPRTYHGCDY